MRRNINIENNVEKYLRKNIKIELGALMENRRRLLAPLPISAMELYEHMWTEEQKAALEVLKPLAHIGPSRDYFEIEQVPLPDDKRGATITIHMKEYQPCRRVAIVFRALPPEIREPLAAWCPKYLECTQDHYAVNHALSTVGGVCKTWGQVHRLWPELESFLGRTAKARIEGAKVQSKLPDGCFTRNDRDEWVLREPFRPDAFERANALLASCLMLPECPETEESKSSVLRV